MEKDMKEIGKVTHFFDKISVAVVELTDSLEVGDKIKIKGTTTDFEQEVKEMQIEHQKIEKAKAGDLIGLKVEEKVRVNDKVYLLG
ncbi:MAG: translation elongation factor-like protein [Candidatus Pacearchaeota archaeon]